MNTNYITYVMEIMNEAMIINSMIKDRECDPVIFVEYSGHTSGLRVDIFALGWKSGRDSTRSFLVYLDYLCDVDTLKEIISVLCAIRMNRS